MQAVLKSFIVLICLLICYASSAQLGNEMIISNTADNPLGMTVGDLDDDGDIDIVVASSNDNTVAWYENLGNGVFSNEKILSANVNGAMSVAIGKLTNSGLNDIVAGGQGEYVWFKNMGGGSFSSKIDIPHPSASGSAVNASDIDQDGIDDIVIGFARSIEWFKSFGNDSIGGPLLVHANSPSASLDFVQDIDLVYMDNDPFPDVIAASFSDDKISWYRNIGNGSFGPQQIVSDNIDGAISVHVTDLNNDGAMDVIAASSLDDYIAWFFNLGNAASWSAKHMISGGLDFPSCVEGSDIDFDGDEDLLFSSQLNNTIGWYENPGDGMFTSQVTLMNTADNPRIILGDDLEGDGLDDFLYASIANDQIAWYRNSSQSTCDSVVNLQSSNIGQTNATLSWDSVNNATSYLLTGALNQSFTNSLTIQVSANSYTANSLTEGTQYFWYVTAVCDTIESSISSTSSFITNIIDYSICSVPVNLGTANISSNSAVISWDAVQQANNYVIRGSQGSFDKSNLVYLTSTSTSVNVSSLQPSTSYFWQVQAVCDLSEVPLSPFSQLNSFQTGAASAKTEASWFYPNPVRNGHFYITQAIETKNPFLRIFDLGGREVKALTLTGNNRVDVDLEPGVYILHLESGELQLTEKLVIH